MTERTVPDDLVATTAADGTLIISGPIDAYTAPDLEMAIEEWHQAGSPGRRVLDLSDVSMMTAAGVRLLLCTSLRHPEVRIRTSNVVDRVAQLCHVALPLVDEVPIDDVPTAAG